MAREVMAKRRLILRSRIVGSVIGRDHVDSSVSKGLTQRVNVFAISKRWIHFRIGAGAEDGAVVKGEMMGRGLARYFDARPTGTTHNINRPGRRYVGDVNGS